MQEAGSTPKAGGVKDGLLKFRSSEEGPLGQEPRPLKKGRWQLVPASQRKHNGDWLLRVGSSCQVDSAVATGRSCRCQAEALGVPLGGLQPDRKPRRKPNRKKGVPSGSLQRPLLADPNREAADPGERWFSGAQPQQHEIQYERMGLESSSNNVITDTLCTRQEDIREF